MNETPVSLLEQIRAVGQETAWKRLVDIYEPMIRRWLAQAGVASNDIDDITQEVLVVVLKKAPEFDRQRTGSFRNWLRLVTLNCLRDFLKSRRRKPLATGDSQFQDVIQQLGNADSGLSRLWNQEHDQHLLRYLLKQIEPKFATATLQAFTKVVLEEAAPDAVAEELGISVNAVFIAKSRVLSQLRQEGEGLLD